MDNQEREAAPRRRKETRREPGEHPAQEPREIRETTEEWTERDQAQFLASKAGRHLRAALLERRETILASVLYACLPAGPRQGGRATPADLREQSVGEMGRIQEIDTLVNEFLGGYE